MWEDLKVSDCENQLANCCCNDLPEDSLHGWAECTIEDDAWHKESCKTSEQAGARLRIAARAVPARFMQVRYCLNYLVSLAIDLALPHMLRWYTDCFILSTVTLDGAG